MSVNARNLRQLGLHIVTEPCLSVMALMQTHRISSEDAVQIVLSNPRVLMLTIPFVIGRVASMILCQKMCKPRLFGALGGPTAAVPAEFCRLLVCLHRLTSMAALLATMRSKGLTPALRWLLTSAVISTGGTILYSLMSTYLLPKLPIVASLSPEMKSFLAMVCIYAVTFPMDTANKLALYRAPGGDDTQCRTVGGALMWLGKTEGLAGLYHGLTWRIAALSVNLSFSK